MRASRRTHDGPRAWAVSVALLCACTHGRTAPTDRVDPDRAALEQAATWPGATDDTLLTLGTAYFSSRRDLEAYGFFQARAEAEPQRGLALAMAALFQVRAADEVPLARRIRWVRTGLSKFDRAVALDPGVSRYLRAAALARVPKLFDRAGDAVLELRWCVTEGDAVLTELGVPPTIRQGLGRAAWQSLAVAYDQAGNDKAAAEALARAGGTNYDPDAAIFATPYAVSAEEGFRFSAPGMAKVAPRVHVARGFDFGNIVFVETSAGVVVIDTGTAVANMRAALQCYRRDVTSAPIHTVILTHGHWDHIGGVEVVAAPGVEVIAQANFATEQARSNASGVSYAWFFGTDARRVGRAFAFDVRPTRLVSEDETLTIGDTTFVLIPVHGGETEDALMVHLPAQRTTLVGDAFMPYFGAPMLAEGDPMGMLDVLDRVIELDPEQLIHGHPPLTQFFTIEAMPGLGAALRELHARVLEGISAAVPQEEVLRDAPMPTLLAQHPAARLPFVVMRTGFVQRLYRQNTGYWQPDGSGLEPVRAADLAKALDLVGRRRPRAWRKAITALLDAGDPSMAWTLSQYAVQIHPTNTKLAALRTASLERLREKYQLFNPFKFIIFSEMSRSELAGL